MEIYIPNFEAGPDIKQLILEFVKDDTVEQEKWYFYRKGCENYVDYHTESMLENEDWDYSFDYDDCFLLMRDVVDSYILEKCPPWIRNIHFNLSLDCSDSFKTWLQTLGFPRECEFYEDFYNEFYEAI